MSLRIRTTISNIDYFLDLYQDEPLNMSFSFAEIQDVTQKNSSFSQSFSLPGTKTNNQIFDYYYNLNSLPVNFDPNKKFPAIITWDGYEIMVGNIRLNQVTIDGEEVVYSVTFYNQVGDLASNIKDKFLRDLDLADLSYPYNDAVIPFCQVDPNLVAIGQPFYPPPTYSFQDGRTWWGLYNIGYNYISGTSVDFLSTPLVQYSPFSGGTYSPKIGYFDYSATPVNDFYFKPTIQIKTLYEHIVNQGGYTISSKFFDTSYFQRYYMPLKFLDETVYPENAQKLCYTYTSDTKSLTSIGVPDFINPSTGITCNNFNLLSNSKQIIFPQDYIGQYTFEISYTLSGAVDPNINFINPSCVNPCYLQYQDTLGNIQTATIPAIDCNLNFSVQGIFISTTGCTVNAPSPSFAQLFFSGAPGQVVSLRTDSLAGNEVQNIVKTIDLILTGSSNIGFYFIYENILISNIQVKITQSPRFLVSGQTIDFSIEFPNNDYKQIDFITSINRYFNLVVIPNPDIPNDLIIEPLIDYIGKGITLDWTTKVDHLQPMQITPTSSFINGTFEYEFKLDQDYANQNYQKASNRIFGTRKEKLNIDYKDDVTKFDYMFGSPLDITIEPAVQNQLTLSSFSKVNTQDNNGVIEQQFVPFKILPRLIFRGLTIPNDNYGFVGTSGTTAYQLWYHKEIGTTRSEDRFTLTNRFTTYPFSYTGFSHYTNWQGFDRTTIQPSEYYFPTLDDLYKIYYKEYVEDLTSKENKLFAAKVYLKPTEIKSLRFNEKILIDNTYFRINKISNYNLLEPAEADIEFIKLTKEYTPHPVLYYDLISCTSGTTYHSNSDLNYNLYAYIGNYIKLFDDNINYLGCYKVEKGVYNSTYSYQHFYIQSAYTPNSVYVFSDCSCTGRTPFNLVQEGLV